MLSLLSRASQPRTLGDESDEEVYFMTGEEARSLLESGATLYGPIITEGQQQFYDDPLNVLDLRNPLPRSILPHFLTSEDFQLLSRVRDTILEGATAERCTAQVTEWNKWRDDED
ncbi:hypothetical protein EJ02DRAFT_422629 [Clathrospora elynae]|uniref:Uncharacterized protein n=1 Tax=Clathrospora elynae TaxID=706981 RepID=A0A6A5SNZ7_9PLEO|nr:hypothetical protein EJ02DRAFT_422629 [Clathrospora elynae]